MRLLTVFTFILVSTSTFSQSESTNKMDEFDTKFVSSISIQFDKYFPLSESYRKSGVHRFGAFGLAMEFWNIRAGIFRMHQRLGGSFGSKTFEDVMTDSLFSTGYYGGMNAETMRFSAYIGPVIGIQPTDKIKISIPINVSARYIQDKSKLYLNDGQGFDEDQKAEFISDHTYVSSESWLIGLKTGLELCFFPDEDFSIIASYNFQSFGDRVVFDHEDYPNYYSPVGPKVNYPEAFTGVKSSEIGFSIGIRYYFRNKKEDPVEEPSNIQ